MVLVTSRSQLTELIALDGAASLTVGLLTVEEARELLARRLGSGRIAREQEATDRVIASLGDARRRLDVLSAGPDGADVRAVFSWSYRKLSVSAARLFRLLGLHPGPDISLPAAARLAGLGSDDTRRVLGEMMAAHVITERTPGRYVLHDLLRTYAAEQAAATKARASSGAAPGGCSTTTYARRLPQP